MKSKKRFAPLLAVVLRTMIFVWSVVLFLLYLANYIVCSFLQQSEDRACYKIDKYIKKKNMHCLHTSFHWITRLNHNLVIQ